MAKRRKQVIPKAAPRLERHVEKPVVDHAKKLGCLVRKMNGLGYRGWPDQMFITPTGKVFFIEFKRPGSDDLSEGQLGTILALRSRDIPAVLCDDIQAGKEYVDLMVRP